MTNNTNTLEPHRRYNPLRKSWVLVSPHRTQRPWQGAQEQPQIEQRPHYDPKCYLCPGNTRAQGDVNPVYTETFVFPNDYAAVKQDVPSAPSNTQEDFGGSELFQAEQVTGKCKVICFSPRHDLTLARMTPAQLEVVVGVWQDVYKSSLEDPSIKYCQIFENKGAAMGCSNPHPHGQAWMTSVVPEEPAVERAALHEFHEKHGHGLLEEYVQKEVTAQTRVVAETPSFVAVVPYWATWPFEVLVISKRRVPNIMQLTNAEKADLAAVLKVVTVRYDNVFKCSFPYSMGMHQGEDPVTNHFHLHFYPPLLRSATVRKFLVGFEMLGMPQRDLTPEKAAETLRAVSGDVHYLDELEQ